MRYGTSEYYRNRVERFSVVVLEAGVITMPYDYCGLTYDCCMYQYDPFLQPSIKYIPLNMVLYRLY